jgi:periplasmic protein TonB
MNGPAISLDGALPAPRHFLSQASAGSLLLHALAIGLLALLGSRVAKAPETPPAIEVELSFAPAAQPADPARRETSPPAQKPVPREKLPTPHPAPLSTPNQSSETPVAQPFNEPPSEKSTAAPAPASGPTTESPGHAKADSTNSGDNRQPYVVFGPRPSYPPEARAGGREGKVRVKVVIGENGTPGEIQLAESSGSTSLDEAALTALRRWRFQPALRNGQPVLAWVTVPVIFSLR